MLVALSQLHLSMVHILFPSIQKCCLTNTASQSLNRATIDHTGSYRGHGEDTWTNVDELAR
jgi:hypothetical protein